MNQFSLSCQVRTSQTHTARCLDCQLHATRTIRLGLHGALPAGNESSQDLSDRIQVGGVDEWIDAHVRICQ